MNNISNKESLYQIKALSKTVKGPAGIIEILKTVDLEIFQGESLAIYGASGSGKSTLLHLLAGLDSPTSGEIKVLGKDLLTFSDKEKSRLRNQAMGFVFQFHHLLPEFNTIENIAMKGIIAGMSVNEAIKKAQPLLELVGLSHREKNLVGTLSGGEQQRVAIARALLLDPKVLFADEPTGNLDENASNIIVEILEKLCQERCMTLVMVTHDMEIAHRMGRVFELKSGELYEQTTL